MAKTSLIQKTNNPPPFAVAHPVRQHHRCSECGRPRAYMRKFGLCRICFRLRALRGEIPGVVKSSW